MPEKTFAELLEEATENSRMMDAPLGERLKAVADEVNRLSPEFAGVVARMVARLEAKHVGQSARGQKIGDWQKSRCRSRLGRQKVFQPSPLDNAPAQIYRFHRPRYWQMPSGKSSVFR